MDFGKDEGAAKSWLRLGIYYKAKPSPSWVGSGLAQSVKNLALGRARFEDHQAYKAQAEARAWAWAQL